MLTSVEIGWTVLFNDHTGTKCPALVTKTYTANDAQSTLDLHVVGIKNNSSFARGKLAVEYGVDTIGKWEYSVTRDIRINKNDLPINGESLIYNSTTDMFETETVNTNVDIDGGTF